jgi:putative chitinase
MLLAVGAGVATAERWTPTLNAAAEEFEIINGREIPWIANLAHECAGFTGLVENLNYSAELLMEKWPCTPRRPWGFTYDEANRFARKPEAIANRIYANRVGNGNSQSGDGWMFRGRGPIQLTFRDNYQRFGDAIGVDLLADPDQACQATVGSRIAGRYWWGRGCNELADVKDYSGIRRAINGGLNGHDKVLELIAKLS